MKLGLAFEHLNLRRNPFSVPEDDDWPALVEGDFDELARAVRAGVAVQVVGDAGRGKSTHLRGLRARLPRAHFVYVNEGSIPDLPRDGIVLVDEAQRLPRGWLSAWLRADHAIAVGTHVDLSRELRAREVRTVELVGIDSARMRRIVERRIEWARRAPGPVPTLADGALDALVARFGDDLRAAEQHLYDVFQDLDRVTVIDAI